MGKPTVSELAMLGHTMIGESRWDFYLDGDDIPEPCGCFIGSVGAAMGDTGALLRHSGTEWLTKQFPWTGRPMSEFPELVEAHDKAWMDKYDADPMAGTAARAISNIHHSGMMNRMQLAELVARIEPKEPDVDAEMQPQEAARPTLEMESQPVNR